MKITKRQLRRIIREAGQLNLPLGGGGPGGEYAYGEFARTPEVQNMLMDAGFNADGSFGADGYPGPSDWGLYSPENIEEAGLWIEAAISMNEALRKAERDLDSGVYQYASDAYQQIISPVQQSFASTGAADTEGRERAGDWLEKAGWEW
jgi:hypothetical protein